MNQPSYVLLCGALAYQLAVNAVYENKNSLRDDNFASLDGTIRKVREEPTLLRRGKSTQQYIFYNTNEWHLPSAMGFRILLQRWQY